MQELSAGIHNLLKVAFCVASWNQSTQPPTPLAMGDQKIDIVLKAIAGLETKMTSMETSLTAKS